MPFSIGVDFIFSRSVSVLFDTPLYFRLLQVYKRIDLTPLLDVRSLESNLFNVRFIESNHVRVKVESVVLNINK